MRAARRDQHRRLGAQRFVHRDGALRRRAREQLDGTRGGVVLGSPNPTLDRCIGCSSAITPGISKHGMPGHLFIVQADLTRLAVDALAIPTDRARTVEESWLRHAPGALRRDDACTIDAPKGAVVRWDQWSDGRKAYLVDVGRTKANKAEWYATRAEAFLDAAIAELAEQPRLGRERPLIGLPVLGTRHAGAAAKAGGIIDELVKRLTARAQSQDRFDVVLATKSAATFAACQQVRRRLERDRPPDDRSDLVHRLADEALQGGLVVFLGAGVSAAAGLPTWTGLLRKLAKRLDRADRDAIASVENLLDRARLIADAYADRGLDLGAAIAEHMDTDHYALGHALLASLPVTEVVTTNYDRLFELAATDADRPAAVLPYEAVARGRRWLLKMHGTIDPPRDIVLTREDYLEYGRTRGALLGIVQALLITRHMLFVGFSLDDDNFIRVAHDVRSAVRRPDRDTAAFGTVLTLVEDRARRLLWQRDFVIEPMERDAGDDVARARAAREIEILLDRVLTDSRPELSHLLDKRFAEALDPDERAVSEALTTLAKAAGTGPAWQPVHEFLRTFQGVPSTATTSRSTESSQPSSSGAVGPSS